MITKIHPIPKGTGLNLPRGSGFSSSLGRTGAEIPTFGWIDTLVKLAGKPLRIVLQSLPAKIVGEASFLAFAMGATGITSATAGQGFGGHLSRASGSSETNCWTAHLLALLLEHRA